MNNDRRLFGENVLVRRKRMGMSQEALGEAIGVSKGAINKWEKGGGIELENAIKLAESFGITLEELVGRNQSIELRNKPPEEITQITATAENRNNLLKEAFDELLAMSDSELPFAVVLLRSIRDSQAPEGKGA